MCPMVFAVLAQLPRSGGDDGGARTVGGPRHHLALGSALRAHFESSGFAVNSGIRIDPGGWTKRTSESPADGPIFTGQWIPLAQPSTLCCRLSGSDCGQIIRKMRFSAARYSFWCSNCWLTSPVTYDRRRTYWLFFMGIDHHRKFHASR